MTRQRIAIVGGGLAGITAALDCAREGAEVTLLESRGRLGGAAYSFSRDGLTVDNGQHVFLRCCTAYQDLVRQLKANDLVTLQPRLDIAVLAPGNRRARLRRTALPAPLHLAAALLRYRHLDVRRRLAVARAMQSLRRVDFDDPATDERSFGDWLREHGQDARTVESMWALIARPTLNLVPDDASLAQAAQVFQLGLLRDATAGDVGYARVPLGEIHDRAAQRALAAAGVTVLLRRGVTRIEVGAGSFRLEMNGAPSHDADAVVLAVPPDRASRLLPPAAGVCSQVASRLGRSPIVDLHVIYDRPVLDLPFAAGVGTPVQWIFDRTHSSGLPRGGQYLAVSLSAAEEEQAATVDELRAKYLPALAELLPAAAGATVRSFFVTRDHAATFRAAPGARAWRPPARTQLPGMALAGAWTDTGWPATMEGAVRSGHSASREVLHTLSAAAPSAAARTAAAITPEPPLVGRGA